MSVPLDELTAYLDQCLQPDRFQDYCPNGLQVEGRPAVASLASGVTASLALLEEAIAWGADAVLVHHGYFWRGETPRVVGMKRRRLAALLRSDTSLIAYHLPLDAHPDYGNNVRFGMLMGIEPGAQEALQPGTPGAVGSIGSLPAPVTAGELVSSLAGITERQPLHIGDPQGTVQRIAWCTGAAQGYIDKAVAAGADLYVTGEASEQTVHVAREEGIHFVAAGHHATERYGVQALGRHLAQRYGLEHRFFDIHNPV
ncbi:MAG: Nif3-like dinuclear metal center hexameric protein [Halioglobus sp.]|nr:Nif3-like dinuclear metal center hexameric protein [Halioglobus sp.]